MEERDIREFEEQQKNQENESSFIGFQEEEKSIISVRNDDKNIILEQDQNRNMPLRQGGALALHPFVNVQAVAKKKAPLLVLKKNARKTTTRMTATAAIISL